MHNTCGLEEKRGGSRGGGVRIAAEGDILPREREQEQRNAQVNGRLDSLRLHAREAGGRTIEKSESRTVE